MNVAPATFIGKYKKNRKETPTCLISHLLVVFTRQLKILVRGCLEERARWGRLEGSGVQTNIPSGRKVKKFWHPQTETCVFASFFHLTKQTAHYTGFMYHMFAFCRLSALLIGISFDWQINSSHESDRLCCKIIQRTKETKTWRRKGQHFFL